MQIRHYSFDAAKMRAPVQIQPYQELAEDGSNLAGFLDFLRDDGTSNFQNLERTLSECLPEFDEIGFDRPGPGTKALKLRRRGRNDHIPAPLLSEGTLYIVALIAIAYQANMPALICIEEPDHGIHPALYRRIYDTLCRLAFPKEYKETFNPIQVITTTHSPYFLNAFTDHPEHVIACEREVGKGVIFRNLGNDTTAKKILQDSLIGDAWASGALSSFEATVS
jgi:predicted ATPase